MYLLSVWESSIWHKRLLFSYLQPLDLEHFKLSLLVYNLCFKCCQLVKINLTLRQHILCWLWGNLPSEGTWTQWRGTAQHLYSQIATDPVRFLISSGTKDHEEIPSRFSFDLKSTMKLETYLPCDSIFYKSYNNTMLHPLLCLNMNMDCVLWWQKWHIMQLVMWLSCQLRTYTI